MAQKETIYASINFDKENTAKILARQSEYKESKINVSIEFVVNELLKEKKTK